MMLSLHPIPATVHAASLDEKINGFVYRNSTDSAIPPKWTLLVIGVCRGGTSLIASLLHGMDIYMGEPNQLRAGGAFESEPCMDPAQWRTEIERRNVLYGRWGMKNPHGNAIFDKFLPLTRNPRCIFVFRCPIATACGRDVREKEPIPLTSISHSFSELSAIWERFRDTDCPSMAVSYERVRAWPALFVHAAAEFLGMEVRSEWLTEAAQRTMSRGGYRSLPGDWVSPEERCKPLGT